MDFNKYLLAALVYPLVFLSGACADSTNKSLGGDDTKTIGQALASFMPQYHDDFGSTGVVVTHDEQVGRIHQFDLDSLTLMRSMPVRPAQNHSILLGQKGNYLVDIADGHIDIVDATGRRSSSPLTFAGKPETGTYSLDDGLFAIIDEFKSIGLMELSSEGAVIASWMGGSKLGTETIALAGDMLSGNRLLVSMTDLSLAIIDVKATMAAEKWQFQKTEPLVEALDWIAHIPSHPDWVMATTATKLIVYDLGQQQVLSEIAVTEVQAMARFRGTVPHVYVGNEASIDVYVVDDSGALQKNALPENIGLLNQSVLDVDKGILTFVTATRDLVSQQTVYRLRFSDNLLMFKKATSSSVKTGITPQYVFFQYDSPLGHLERSPYVADPEIKALSGYNLKFLGN